MARPTFSNLVDERLAQIRDEAESGASHMTGKLKYAYQDIDRQRGQDGPMEQGEVIGRLGGLNIPELLTARTTPQRGAAAIRRGKGVVYQRIRHAAEHELERAGYSRKMGPRKRGGRLAVPGHPRITAKCSHCTGPHTTDQHRFHGEGAFHTTHLFAFNPMTSGTTWTVRANSKRAAVDAVLKEEAMLGREVAGRPMVKEIQKGRLYSVVVFRPEVGKQKLKKNCPNPPRQGVQIYKPTRGVVIAGMQKPPGHPCDQACKRAGHKYQHKFKGAVEVIGLPDGSIIIRGKK